MTDIDPMAALHRANQAFHEQMLQTAGLACGVAYFSADFGPIANQVRDVALPSGWTMGRAYEEVQGFFAGLGCPCRNWAPAPDRPTDELESFLTDHGFTAFHKTAMALRPWPDLPPRPAVRVLPGRAMKRALGELLMNDPSRATPPHRQLASDMFLSRLDDPRFDVLVTLMDGQAVGHGCLLQVGPIAAIYDVYVQEDYRRRGCGLAIVHDLVTTCRRLELRTVLLEVGVRNAAAMTLYERCGFKPVGSTVEFGFPLEGTPS